MVAVGSICLHIVFLFVFLFFYFCCVFLHCFVKHKYGSVNKMFSIHFGYELIDIFLVTLENFIYNLPSNNPFTRRGLVHPPRSMSMGSMSILLKHVKNRHPHSEIISHAIQQSKSCRQGSLSSPDLTSYGEMHWDLTSDIMPHIRWKLGGCLCTELYAV